MKNFQNYAPDKYTKPDYQEVKAGIYRTKDPYSIQNEDIFVTSLSFELEPECYGEEDSSPQYIPQVPFELLLDEFLVFVTDFYEQENRESETLCYQEFGSSRLEDIQRLRTIIGKRCYAVPYIDKEDEEEYYNIVIE